MHSHINTQNDFCFVPTGSKPAQYSISHQSKSTKTGATNRPPAASQSLEQLARLNAIRLSIRLEVVYTYKVQTIPFQNLNTRTPEHQTLIPCFTISIGAISCGR